MFKHLKFQHNKSNQFLRKKNIFINKNSSKLNKIIINLKNKPNNLK